MSDFKMCGLLKDFFSGDFEKRLSQEFKDNYVFCRTTNAVRID